MTRRTMPHISLQNFFNMILYLCWTLGIVAGQELNNYPNSGPTDGRFGSTYFYYQQPEYPRDCREAFYQCSTNNFSGINVIKPDGYPEPFEVYCDNTVDSMGWTVIHRIQDGYVFFNRNWTEFKVGFGFLSQEFWIGHDKLSFLTNQNAYELRIDLTSADGLTFHVTYNKFRISDESGEYKLTSVGQYNGTEEEIDRFFCPPSSEGGVYISHDCSRLCSCTGGQFVCSDTYKYSTNAVCEDRGSGSRRYCNAGYIGDGVTCTVDIPPSDCQDVYDRGSTLSGVYKIKPTTWLGEPFDVFCNMTNGEGWTVFQRRIDGSQDFHLYWSDYEAGFGTPDHELWLGNGKLHSLTSQRSYELRIDFVNSLGDPYYAKYDSFRISDESDNYRLSRGTYSGDAGDSLNYNNGQAFTTRDRDNDRWSANCATWRDDNDYFCGLYSCSINGGWWYNKCGNSHPNSPYGTNCFQWYNLPGNRCNIKFTEMKIRPT